MEGTVAVAEENRQLICACHRAYQVYLAIPIEIAVGQRSRALIGGGKGVDRGGRAEAAAAVGDHHHQGTAGIFHYVGHAIIIYVDRVKIAGTLPQHRYVS